MVDHPGRPAMAVFLADGTNIQGLPATQAGPNGVEFVSTQVGSWEPVSERGVHFTGVQLLSDANGTLVGTVEIDAYPVVSEDGQTLCDDDPRSGPIIRDAAGTSSPTCGGRRPAGDRGPDGRGSTRLADRDARRHTDDVAPEPTNDHDGLENLPSPRKLSPFFSASRRMFNVLIEQSPLMTEAQHMAGVRAFPQRSLP